MKLNYDIKFDIDEVEKKNIMVNAIWCELQMVVILMIIAGIVGVSVAVFEGWYLGMGAFMFVTAVILMSRDWIRSRFMYAEIDALMKKKLAEQ